MRSERWRRILKHIYKLYCFFHRVSFCVQDSILAQALRTGGCLLWFHACVCFNMLRQMESSACVGPTSFLSDVKRSPGPPGRRRVMMHIQGVTKSHTHTNTRKCTRTRLRRPLSSPYTELHHPLEHTLRGDGPGTQITAAIPTSWWSFDPTRRMTTTLLVRPPALQAARTRTPGGLR